jgi:hypothetical protein
MMVGGNKFAMDVRTNIKARLPNRHVTEGRPFVGMLSCWNEAASSSPSHENIVESGELTMGGLADDALAGSGHTAPFEGYEIFKKTPCVADLKRGGRYVAKDILEIGGIPHPAKTLRDHGYLHGDCLTFNGRILEDDAWIDTLNVKLSAAELAERKTKPKPRETNQTTGALWKYAQRVGPAVDGAVTHPGEAHEKQCYADI